MGVYPKTTSPHVKKKIDLSKLIAEKGHYSYWLVLFPECSILGTFLPLSYPPPEFLLGPRCLTCQHLAELWLGAEGGRAHHLLSSPVAPRIDLYLHWDVSLQTTLRGWAVGDELISPQEINLWGEESPGCWGHRIKRQVD